jgi:hypothetical protein
MNPETIRQKKFAIAGATAHLFFWFWMLAWMGKKTAPGSPVVVGAMIGLMIAAWLQYRTVLALRRLKQEDVGGAGK